MSLPPDAKKRARTEITRFALVAEKYQARWHYSQNRPFSGLGVPFAFTHYDDCSAYAALLFYAAAQAGHAPMADPLGLHYSGYGNTQTALAYLQGHHAPRDKYRVGDMAIYGPAADTKHMTICRKGGTGSSSVWTSFGQESGPQTESLHYRSDLLGVYRHPALL